MPPDPIGPLQMLLPPYYVIRSLTRRIKDAYVSMLFVYYSSAFSMVITHKFIHKLSTLGLHPTFWDWLLDIDYQAPVCQDW